MDIAGPDSSFNCPESCNTTKSLVWLGIQLGEPTGLNAKLWTGRSNAFDFTLAWSFEGSGRNVDASRLCMALL